MEEKGWLAEDTEVRARGDWQVRESWITIVAVPFASLNLNILKNDYA